MSGPANTKMIQHVSKMEPTATNSVQQWDPNRPSTCTTWSPKRRKDHRTNLLRKRVETIIQKDFRGNRLGEPCWSTVRQKYVRIFI